MAGALVDSRFGGSFIHTFTKPGIYDYFCELHPGQIGRIVVGDAVERGQNGKMNMAIGANAPFNSTELRRIVVAIHPLKNVVDLPPTTAITYDVRIDNPITPSDILSANNQTTVPSASQQTASNQSSVKWPYHHEFVDSDGVLYLEFIPQPEINGTSSGFTTWGPDVSGSATGPQTGTFHIKGPVLVEDRPYTLTVSITAIDDKIPPKPIIEKFLLSPQLAGFQQ